MLRVCEFLGCGVETDMSMPIAHDVILPRTNKMIFLYHQFDHPTHKSMENGCTFPSSQSTNASAWHTEHIFQSSLLIQYNFSVSYIILQQG